MRLCTCDLSKSAMAMSLMVVSVAKSFEVTICENLPGRNPIYLTLKHFRTTKIPQQRTPTSTTMSMRRTVVREITRQCTRRQIHSSCIRLQQYQSDGHPCSAGIDRSRNTGRNLRNFEWKENSFEPILIGLPRHKRPRQLNMAHKGPESNRKTPQRYHWTTCP